MLSITAYGIWQKFALFCKLTPQKIFIATWPPLEFALTVVGFPNSTHSGNLNASTATNSRRYKQCHNSKHFFLKYANPRVTGSQENLMWKEGLCFQTNFSNCLGGKKYLIINTRVNFLKFPEPHSWHGRLACTAHNEYCLSSLTFPVPTETTFQDGKGAG